MAKNWTTRGSEQTEPPINKHVFLVESVVNSVHKAFLNLKNKGCVEKRKMQVSFRAIVPSG